MLQGTCWWEEEKGKVGVVQGVASSDGFIVHSHASPDLCFHLDLQSS